MIELDIHAIEELIIVYSRYYSNGIDDNTVDAAKSIYNELIPGSTLIDKEIMKAVVRLFPIAYPGSDTGENLPTKEETREIIAELKNLKINLEK